MGRLQGKVAVVTGASSGIGAAIATALAREGASVALVARRVDRLEEVCKTISQTCPSTRCVVAQADVTSRQQVKDAIGKATSELGGPVDILVNNAGVMYYTLMKNVQEEQWERTVDVVCKGTLHGIGAVLPSMLERGAGHIVNITSDAGRKAFPGLAVYSGAKFFVEATSQALRLETAGTGLRVTCVQPGNVATELLGMSTDPEGIAKYGTPSGAKVLEADDVANAVVYAVTQPHYVAVNEILVEPRDEPA
eukprot:jgi/Mesvir1/28706/Mv19677-RA.1